MPREVNRRTIDVKQYEVLLERAVQTVLEPVRQSVHGGQDAECLYLFPLVSLLPHREVERQVGD